MAQLSNALGAGDALIAPNSPHLLLGRLTQADVTAFVAERLARNLGVDTAARMPRLRELMMRLGEQEPFRSTEPQMSG